MVYSDEDIKKAIMCHAGDAIPGFPAIDAFLALLTPELKKLSDPAVECINEVYHVLEDLAIRILDVSLEKTPHIKL